MGSRLAGAAVGLLVVAASACSIDTGGNGAASRPSTTAPATASTTPGSGGGAPDENATEDSTAYVEIAGTAYSLAAACHAAGAGEVVITALTEGLTEPRVELYVQAFLGEPYVGVTVTTGDTTTTYEPGLGVPLAIAQQGDVYRVDDVEFVADLDLDTGDGASITSGTVVVECRSYAVGLPPGFVSG